jgi:hypothetical protein
MSYLFYYRFSFVPHGTLHGLTPDPCLRYLSAAYTAMGEPFPTDWNVYPEDEYPAFQRVDTEDEDRSLLVFMRLNANHEPSGRFRIFMFGGGGIDIRIPFTKLIPAIPPHLQHLSLLLAFDIEEMTPVADLVVTQWEDVAEMLQMKTAALLDHNDKSVHPAEMIKFLSTPSTDKIPAGAAIRWAVAADENRILQLELQYLPAQAKYLQKAYLKGENSVSVLLGRYPLNTNYFDGTVISGPVPYFFAADPETAAAHLLENPNILHQGIAEVNSRFLLMEHVSLEDAQSYLKKKLRAAKGTPAFPAVVQPAAKKRRTTVAPPSESGTDLV